MTETTYWLGIGANIGDPRAQMADAIRRIGDLSGTNVEAVAPLYKTPPWGITDQPYFLNSALAVSSDFAPLALLGALKAIEMAMERVGGQRWGPRPIDLDIIAWSEGIFDNERLHIPHARAHDRGFVLVPLADLNDDLPLQGNTVADLLSKADTKGIERAADANWHLATTD
ncbi:MAG: 2-amino-4-hydroxy-6-hydroxymethyldihydropteridine diphosphokinase [Pseudomonadota bacterium]